MLTVERQRSKECMLATIAALAGRPYPEVRTYARQIMGKPWSSHWGRKASTRSPISFRSAVLDIASHFGGTALATLVDSNDRNGGGSLFIALLAVGRGVVRFLNKRKRWSGHIVPWVDGLIHDTDESTPCTLDKYLKRHSFWARLDYVRSIAFDGSPEDNPTPSPDMGY